MQANQANESDRHGNNGVDPQDRPQDGPQLSGAGLFAACDPPSFTDAIAGSNTRPCRFLFAYGELPVIGELRPGPDGAQLQILVVVGRLPYSVESRDQREKMLNIIRAFPAGIRESLVIAQDQSICVSTAAPTPAPLTPAGFISDLVVRLFRLDPVLRSLADVLPGLAPALVATPAANAKDPSTGTSG